MSEKLKALALKVTTADLVEYLNQFPPNTEVGLNKDGWMEDEIKAATPRELIKRRGLFFVGKLFDETYLIINN